METNIKLDEHCTLKWVLRYRSMDFDGGVQLVEAETYEKAKSMFDVAISWSSEAVLYRKETSTKLINLEYFKKEEEEIEEEYDEDAGKKSHDNY